jgi:hypothetical protein
MELVHHMPSDVEPESVGDLVEDCRCLEGECTSHGISLHPAHHEMPPHPVSTEVTEQARHLIDGYSDYGD